MSSSYNDLHDIISMLRNCNIIRLEKLFRSTYIPFYLSFYVISWKRIISIDAYSSYNWDTIYNFNRSEFRHYAFWKRINYQTRKRSNYNWDAIHIPFYLYFSRYIIWIADVIIFWKRIVFDQYYFELIISNVLYSKSNEWLSSGYMRNICWKG